MAIPTRVRERLVSGLKRFSPILVQQRDRDVSEADTVTLVKDCLADVFGYDKYAELTSEYAIRGTFCDLAVKIEQKLSQLIEVKAIGMELDDRHVKQAVDYASNQGVEWVVLTNGIVWRLYQVIFAKPIDKRLLAQVDLLQVDPKKDESLDLLYLFSKEGFLKGAHIELRDRQDATSRYTLAALLVRNDSVVSCIRRELRRVVDVLVSDEEIIKVLRDAVIKRDTLEGPEAESAARTVNRSETKTLRTAKPDNTAAGDSVATPAASPPANEG